MCDSDLLIRDEIFHVPMISQLTELTNESAGHSGMEIMWGGGAISFHSLKVLPSLEGGGADS